MVCSLLLLLLLCLPVVLLQTLNVSKTFYLYGTHDGSKGEGDLKVELKVRWLLLPLTLFTHLPLLLLLLY